MSTTLVPMGRMNLGDETDSGIRPFVLDLAELDVPVPVTPRGGDTSTKYVFTSEGAKHWARSLVGTPVRIAPNGKTHFVDVKVDGELQKRLASPFGYFENAYVVEEDGRKLLRATGKYWTKQDPVVTKFVAENRDDFGGSFEVTIPQGGRRVEGDTTFIDFCHATGAAILERASAAFRQLTKLLAFEAYPEAAGLAAEAQDEWFALLESDSGDGALLYLQIASNGNAELSPPVSGESEMGADAERGMVDASVVATAQESPLAQQAEEDRRVPMDETLNKRLEELVAEATTLKIESGALKDQLLQREEADKAALALLAKHGVSTVPELIAQFEAKIEAVKNDLGESEKFRAAQTAENLELQGKLHEVTTDTMFAEAKDRYPVEVHGRLREVLAKQVKGEVFNTDDLNLLLQAAAPVKAPNGEAVPHPQAEEVLIAEAGVGADPNEVFAEANRRFVAGEFGKTDSPQAKMRKDEWLNRAIEAQLGGVR